MREHDGCSVICIWTHYLHIIWGFICGKMTTSLCCCNAVTVWFGFVPSPVVFCWRASALEYKLHNKSHNRNEKRTNRGNQQNWRKKVCVTSEIRFIFSWLCTCCLGNSLITIETIGQDSDYSRQQQSNGVDYCWLMLKLAFPSVAFFVLPCGVCVVAFVLKVFVCELSGQLYSENILIAFYLCTMEW